MGRFIPLIIWLISAIIFYAIAKRRGVRITLAWNLAVVFLGPFAIPLLLFAKSGSVSPSHSAADR